MSNEKIFFNKNETKLKKLSTICINTLIYKNYEI